MIPIIDKNLCSGCCRCRDVCPPGALSLAKDVIDIQEDLCEECGFCAAECPLSAIVIPFATSDNGSDRNEE